jgi:hypothetical protein
MQKKESERQKQKQKEGEEKEKEQEKKTKIWPYTKRELKRHDDQMYCDIL